MNYCSVTVKNWHFPFLYRCIICEALKTDLIISMKQTKRVNFAARQTFTQIMILAEILPCFPSNFSDVEFELIPSLKKKIFALRQKELLFVAINQPIGFYPFNYIVMA